MSPLEYALQQLHISDPEEKRIFHQSLHHLAQETYCRNLIHPAAISELYELWGKLLARQTPISLMLQTQDQLLLSFFQAFQRLGLELPKGPVAGRILIRLCNMDLYTVHLEALLRCGLLDDFPADKLQQLEMTYPANIKTLIEFYAQYRETLSVPDINLAYEMLLLIYPSMLDEESAAHLNDFLRNILPFFVERFAHRMPQETLYTHTDRVVEWWILWTRHQLKLEKELDTNDPYYTTDFPLIVKYITEYIWWNNGLIYRNGDKNYHFGSPEFCHLAMGGSIRKGPDFRPYTRRMARAFATLPYDFPYGPRDMYLYFYGESLGAGGHLQELLPEFVRHQDNFADLSQELDRWNPVVQKLAVPEFEALNFQQARELLGYLYHCLRDQPDFSVRGRTVQQLCGESDAHLERIQARAQHRQARYEARMARRVESAPREIATWNPHPQFRPWELNHKGYKYKIIELTTENQLVQEGSVMKHCVGSYSRRCQMGGCTIWSLRQLRKDQWYSLVTLEVVVDRIIQSNAPFNAVPLEEHRQIIAKWAERENIVYR